MASTANDIRVTTIVPGVYTRREVDGVMFPSKRMRYNASDNFVPVPSVQASVAPTSPSGEGKFDTLGNTPSIDPSFAGQTFRRAFRCRALSLSVLGAIRGTRQLSLSQ